MNIIKMPRKHNPEPQEETSGKSPKKKLENKSKYPSIYSPHKFVTASQYIIELVCQKKAKKEGRDLPIQFWKLPEWQQFFKSQLRKCHLLLKQYNEFAIINALKNNRAYSITSLFAPWLIPIIEEEQRIWDIKQTIMDNAKTTKIDRDNTNSQPRQHKIEKNNRSKLMELDNG